MSNSLWPRGLQHARLPCPSPTHYFPLFYFLPAFLRAKHAESTQVRVSISLLGSGNRWNHRGNWSSPLWSWVVRGNAASAWLSGHLSFSPESSGRESYHIQATKVTHVERPEGEALRLFAERCLDCPQLLQAPIILVQTLFDSDCMSEPKPEDPNWGAFSMRGP